MDFYDVAELEQVLRRSAKLLSVELPDEGAHEIARRSRGTPRIANRLLRRVRDFAEVRAEGVIDREIAAAALNLYEVDAEGLDRLDRAVLDALLRKFGGGPVGLSTLAVAVGRSRRPSRSWPSPSWCGRGCWPAPEGPRRHRGRLGAPRHDPASRRGRLGGGALALRRRLNAGRQGGKRKPGQRGNRPIAKPMKRELSRPPARGFVAGLLRARIHCVA